jgi:hypothetical protein
MIDPATLQQLIDYEPASGIFRWKHRDAHWFAEGRTGSETVAKVWNTRYAEKETFKKVDKDGYYCGAVMKNYYQAHRLAWAIFYGKWPDGQIDHINGVRNDNRIDNLRDVPPIGNSQNRRVSPKNTSGYMGVTWHKQLNKWQAQIGVGRQTIYLGVYDNFDDAVIARKAAEAGNGFHENHGRAAA